VSALPWAIPAALALLGVYRIADPLHRHTIRLAAAAALWAALICLLITWS
jgi:hypothetical protein